jgi:hypothetical protein
MSDVIAFPAERATPRRTESYQEPAEIVIFPGVRIERMGPVSRDDIPPRPRRRSGPRKGAPTRRPA